MAQLMGLQDIEAQIRAALGERKGTEHIAAQLAVALAGEGVAYLDVSGLQVGEADVLRGSVVAITDTRVLVERVAAGDEQSTVEARPRKAITQIDYSGPAGRWLDASPDLPLPEGCFVTVHFAHSGSLQLPVEPASSYSASQRALAEMLSGLTNDLCT